MRSQPIRHAATALRGRARDDAMLDEKSQMLDENLVMEPRNASKQREEVQLAL